MKGIYEGGLQPASMQITDHLEQVSDQEGVMPDCGPQCMDPKSGSGADPTSGADYKKNFIQDSSYTTAGTDLEIRDAQRTVPTEVKWNGMK